MFDFSFKTIHIYILKINSVVESSTSRLYKIVHNIFQNVKMLILKISL